MLSKQFLARFLSLLACVSPIIGQCDPSHSFQDIFLPHELNSAAGFDQSSRAEIAVFALSLDRAIKQDDLSLAKKVDQAKLKRIFVPMQSRLLLNYQLAQMTCSMGDYFCKPVSSYNDFLIQAREQIRVLTKLHGDWIIQSRAFNERYVKELLMLASLSPDISSEIELFSGIEKDGSELPDRHFLLTFDDGPTQEGGLTDSIIASLNEAKVNAFFFVLESPLKARIDQSGIQSIHSLYKSQCVGSHGKEHLNHQTWVHWKESVVEYSVFVSSVLPKSYRPYFRPPFGGRLPSSGSFFREKNLKVQLWNINSRDWEFNGNIPALESRVLVLMLLWRHGVILFHDTHSDSVEAVNGIIQSVSDAKIQWQDCMKY